MDDDPDNILDGILEDEVNQASKDQMPPARGSKGLLSNEPPVGIDTKTWFPEPSDVSSLGLAGGIFEAILNLLVLLTRQLAQSKHSRRLRSELERLFLWGDSFSVLTGQLDEVLSKSSELHRTVLSALFELGKIIKDDLLRVATAPSRPLGPPSAAASLRAPTAGMVAPTPPALKKPSTVSSPNSMVEPGYSPLDWAALTANRVDDVPKQTKEHVNSTGPVPADLAQSEMARELQQLLEKASAFLDAPDARGDLESLSDDGSSRYGLKEILDDLAIYIDCLMDLSSALESPVIDLEPDSHFHQDIGIRFQWTGSMDDSPQVHDEEFSYITSDDIVEPTSHASNYHGQYGAPAEENEPDMPSPNSVPRPRLDAYGRLVSLPRTNAAPRATSIRPSNMGDPTEVIRRELDAATYHKESSCFAFIPYANLKEAWGRGRLAAFVNHKRLGLGQDQIAITQRDLLCTLTILLVIGWEDWTRFQHIFFPSDRNLAQFRRDENIPYFKFSDLNHPSFLGGGGDRDGVLSEGFLQWRWRFYPVTLREGPPMELNEFQWVLPFTTKPEKGGSVAFGPFGEVTKEVIARGQFIPMYPHVPRNEEFPVIRKRFRTRADARELRILDLLRTSRTSHERIVCDLVTVEMPNEVHILLPWANMDLKKFLEQGHRHITSELRLKDVISEAAELAGALDFLHRGIQTDEKPHKTIVHLDLKPANILVFKDAARASWTGEWRITDFGFSHIIKRSSASARNQAYGPFCSATQRNASHNATYSAPERDHLPSSDIWSFGCILVRVFAFGFGSEELRTLDQQRSQPEEDNPNGRDDYFCRGSRLNSHVKSWIDSLPSEFSSRHNRMFLDDMKSLLLFMFDLDPTKRLDALEVRSWLLKIKNMTSLPSSDDPPLLLAVRTGDTEVARDLLSRRQVQDSIDELTEGMTPLM